MKQNLCHNLCNKLCLAIDINDYYSLTLCVSNYTYTQTSKCRKESGKECDRQYSLLDKIILNISDQSDTLTANEETCDNERL